MRYFFHYFFQNVLKSIYLYICTFFFQSTTNETALLNGIIDNKHTIDSPEPDSKAVPDPTPNADQKDQTSTPPVPAAASNLIAAATNLGAASNLVAVASNLAAAASNLMPEKSPSNSTAHSRQGSQASTTSTSEMKVNLDDFLIFLFRAAFDVFCSPFGYV